MKNLLCIAFLAFISVPMFSQNWNWNGNNNGRDETLANSSGRNGFFISPIIEYTDLNDEWNTSVGGGLAFVAGDFFVGAYGLGMLDENWIDDDIEQLQMGHGGLWLGYVTPQHKALHLFTSVKAGWGAVNIELDDDFDYDDSFFAVTPEAGLEISVFRWFRIAGTVGYRWMNGLDDSSNFDNGSLEGMTAGLTFRIGGFGRDRGRNW